MFYFWGTAEIFLREHTYMIEWAIKSSLTNYTRFDEPSWIKSIRPGNHHYRVRPMPGGFKISACKMVGVDIFASA